jgi:hypothetical protein
MSRRDDRGPSIAGRPCGAVSLRGTPDRAGKIAAAAALAASPGRARATALAMSSALSMKMHASAWFWMEQRLKREW